MYYAFNPQVRTPVLRYGGKVQQAQFYLRLLGPHDCYVEAFGGGGAILMAKHPSRSEVYNDLDSNVVNLFRVLRDPRSAARLKELLELTPYSREEYDNCQSYADDGDPVEKARKFYVATRQAFQKVPGGTWAYSRTQNMSAFSSSIRLFDAACHRLKNVQIENHDFRKVLPTYDSPDTSFLLDPPYVTATRVAKKCYKHEMTDNDHKDLLEIICGLKGRVALCGYPHPLYDRALSHWDRLENHVTCGATMWTGASYGIRKRPPRTEVVWLNRRARKAKTISLPPVMQTQGAISDEIETAA